MASRLRRAGIVGLALSSLVGGMTSVPASAVTVPGWQVTDSPADSRFVGAAAISADDAWMVGQSTSGGSPLAIAYHWDGDAWTSMPSAAPGDFSAFQAVDARTSSDVWAVGGYDCCPVARHWNGTDWSTEPIAPIGDGYPSLRDVSIVSASDGWIVGAVGGQVGGLFMDQPAYLRWDGSDWSGVIPSFTVGAVLTSVDARSTTDAWAGGYRVDIDADPRPFMTHWDGASWSQVALPNIGIGRIEGVVAFGASSAFAVGWTQASSSAPRRTMVLRWNGMAWSSEAAPNLGDLDNELTAIEGTSATDVWAVGSERLDENYRQTLSLHRDASGWSSVPTPNEATLSSTGGFTALAAPSPGTAFAGGRFIAGFGQSLAHDSTLSVDAFSANWGDPITVKGTLGFSRGSFAGQQDLVIARSTAGGPPIEVGTVQTGNGGNFLFLDEPPAQAEYDYTVTYDGDGVWEGTQGSSSAWLYGEHTDVQLHASPRKVDFGERVTLTAHLGAHLDGDQLQIWEKRPGKPERFLTEGTIDSQGKLQVKVKPFGTTEYRAVFPGDTKYGRSGSSLVEILVEPRFMATAIGRDGTDGRFALYRYSAHCPPRPHRGCPTVLAELVPKLPRQMVTAHLQVAVEGEWRTAFESSVRLDRRGKVALRIFYRDRRIIGERLRIHFQFGGDNDYLETWSPFVYFEVVAGRGREALRQGGHGRLGFDSVVADAGHVEILHRRFSRA